MISSGDFKYYRSNTPSGYDSELWSMAVEIIQGGRDSDEITTMDELDSQYKQLSKEYKQLPKIDQVEIKNKQVKKPEVKIAEKDLGTTKSGIPYVEKWQNSKIDYYTKIFNSDPQKNKYILDILKVIKGRQKGKLTSKQRSLIILKNGQSLL